jgi:serine phosphatase RsbU (regulator of sigma subunit)
MGKSPILDVKEDLRNAVGAVEQSADRLEGVPIVRRRPALTTKSYGLLAVLALVCGVLVDALAPEPYTGLPVLAAAPLIAGALQTFRASMCLAVLACFASLGVDFYRGRPAAPRYVDLAVVAVIGALALLVNKLMERQGRDLARARDVAEAMQRAVLPDPPSHAGPLSVAASYTTAHTEARIGGDLFVVQETPFGVRIIIGDVRGKGLQAVAWVSVAVGAFRQEADHAPTLAELARRVDEALSKQADRSGAELAGEEFATAVLAEVSGDGAELRVVNRGHPSPYLVHDGVMVRLDPAVPQLPLGMSLTGSGDEIDPPDTYVLPPGASVLLVTDGVTEARNRQGTFYDPGAAALGDRVYASPGTLVDAVVEDVARWTDHELRDDAAILAVTRTVQAAPVPARTLAPAAAPARVGGGRIDHRRSARKPVPAVDPR